MDAPRIAGRYEVIRPLGRGSFAQTLLARDAEQDRQVAVKVLHPRAASGWKAYELFEREAAVLRELRHHAVPAVHETFRAEWEPKRDLERSRRLLLEADAKYRLNSGGDFFYLERYLRIDNTHLSPAEAARRIVEAFGLPAPGDAGAAPGGSNPS